MFVSLIKLIISSLFSTLEISKCVGYVKTFIIHRTPNFCIKDSSSFIPCQLFKCKTVFTSRAKLDVEICSIKLNISFHLLPDLTLSFKVSYPSILKVNVTDLK